MLIHARIFAQGRCRRRVGLGRWADRRGAGLAGCPFRVCARRSWERGIGGGAVPQEADGPTVPQAGWRPGGPADRAGLRRAARRAEPVDDAVAGGSAGGTGGGHHRPGMRAHDASQNELKLVALRKQWVIPPRRDAEFVCAMEDVLEVYTLALRPGVSGRPAWTRSASSWWPRPGRRCRPHPGQPTRVDCGERCGTAKPVPRRADRWERHVTRDFERRTAVDFAAEVRDLLGGARTAKKVVLVMDNLNTANRRVVSSLRARRGPRPHRAVGDSPHPQTSAVGWTWRRSS